MDKNVPHPKFKYKDEYDTFFKALHKKGCADWMVKNDAGLLTKNAQSRMIGSCTGR